MQGGGVVGKRDEVDAKNASLLKLGTLGDLLQSSSPLKSSAKKKWFLLQTLEPEKVFAAWGGASQVEASSGDFRVHYLLFLIDHFILLAAASQEALGPRKEPAGLLPGSDDRPADVLLPFWANGKDAALDVSVVNPLQQQLVGQVAREGEKGVQHAFNIKVGKYSERCEAEGIVFIPLVVDTFGGWHKDSLEVITKLGRQVSRQTGKEEDEIVRQLRQRVAILLVRDNVNMFDSRTPSYPQAVIDADVDINV